MSDVSEVSLASLSVPDTRLAITLRLPGCEEMGTFRFPFNDKQSFDSLLHDAQTLGSQMQAHTLELSKIDYVAHGHMRHGVRQSLSRILTGQNPRIDRDNRQLTLAQICGLSLWLELNNPVVADAQRLRKSLLWHFQTYRSAIVTIAADHDCTHYATLVTDAPVDDATLDAALKAAPAFNVTKRMRDTYLDRMAALMPEVASRIPALKRQMDRQTVDEGQHRPKPSRRH